MTTANSDDKFGVGCDPSRPENRHVTMDERSIYFPLMTEEEFKLSDVPHCLSMICRYNGFIKKFYSVAQHSVMVCELAEYEYGRGSDIARCALLHDASEAYLGDISRPLKAHLPDYRRLEAHVGGVINRALNLPTDPAIWKEVSKFDVMALHIEANALLLHQYPWVKPPHSSAQYSRMARILNTNYAMHPENAKLEMLLKMREYGYLLPPAIPGPI